MSTLTSKISFNEELDVEGRIFSSCFVKILDKHGNKVFTSREVQEVSQCTLNKLEKLYKNNPKKHH